jgi:flagellar biosynthetic protein FliR
MEAGYPIPESGLSYAMLLAGEALVGIITGFVLVIVYASFQVAGQFFSLQMGFGASQVYDPLAQIQIPLMGQFLNLIAMFVFVGTGGFQKVFLFGVERSITTVRAVDFVLGKDYILRTLFTGLGRIFEQAMIIAFPILGTLFLVSVTMGLLAKAAPQMNLLMLGFPIAISVAFMVILLIIPLLIESFSRIIDSGFETILRLFAAARGAG